MSSHVDYKSSKEAFVSGMTGSSVAHINLISLAALSSIALYSAIRSRLPPNKLLPFPLLTEFCLLTVPLILSTTLFAFSPILLSSILLIPAFLVLFFVPRSESGTPLPSNADVSPRPSPTIPSRELRSSLDGVGVVDESNPSSPARHVHFEDETETSRLERINSAIVTGGEEKGNRNGKGGVAITPLPALSTYRAHMMLLTIICILAVDFPVFPRELAKCETYGVSLMDIGVGSFVFSQGLVSAAPLLKDPSYLSSSLLPKLVRTTRKCAPIILLGLVRVLLVKGTEYPEHVTEYGVHWNFFLTLATIPILQILLHPFIMYMPISLLGVIVAVADQVLLSSGLTNYVLSAPRQGIISANKEGIVSLTGYLAIHLLGLSTGTFLLPPSPSYFRRRQQFYTKSLSQAKSFSTSSSDVTTGTEKADYLTHGPDSPADSWSAVGQAVGDEAGETYRENDRTATELASYAFIWWTLLGACSLLGVGGGVSRRMANLPYVAWVAAYNTSFILGYLLLDLYFFPSPMLKSIYSPTSKLKQHGPSHSTRNYHVPGTPVASGYQRPTSPVPAPQTTTPRPRYARQDSDGRLSVEERPQPVLVGGGLGGGMVGSGGGGRKGGLRRMAWGQVQVGAPTLLEAINRNGLAVFLLANLATGLVNMTMSTMYASDTKSMAVLLGYSGLVCSVAWVCRGRRLWVL